MKVTKFLNIDIEPAPAELELSVELRCREIMASDDVNSIKQYCTHLIRHQMKQDVFLASMLGRLVELEALNSVYETRKQRFRSIRKFFRIR